MIQFFSVFPMEWAVFLSSLTKVYHPEVNMTPKQALLLVQSSCPVEYLMKAIFAKVWAVAVVIG
jgi:hypothetical protein